LLTIRRRETTSLDRHIATLEEELTNHKGHSDEYSKIADQLSKLYKIKDAQSPNPVSRDTMAIIAGNLAGILLIISYERANVVTSKAVSFVMKLR
jgi:hypothetical protein